MREWTHSLSAMRTHLKTQKKKAFPTQTHIQTHTMGTKHKQEKKSKYGEILLWNSLSFFSSSCRQLSCNVAIYFCSLYRISIFLLLFRFVVHALRSNSNILSRSLCRSFHDFDSKFVLFFLVFVYSIVWISVYNCKICQVFCVAWNWNGNAVQR